MRVAGRASWLIGVDQWDQHLEWALWFRAAERIEVRADGPVTGPPDVDPLPTPSLTESDELAEGWLWWWRTLLVRPSLAAPPTPPPDLADLNRFSPPDFEGLAGYPALQRVVTARWGEANAWHSARKQAGIAMFRQAAGGPGEGEKARSSVPWKPKSATQPRRFPCGLSCCRFLTSRFARQESTRFWSPNACTRPARTTTGCVPLSAHSPEPEVRRPRSADLT